MLTLPRGWVGFHGGGGNSASAGRGQTTGAHDMEETHVLSISMALHCNLPPLRQWVKAQDVEVACKLAVNAPFNVRPQHRVSQRIDPRTSAEAAMLQCLEGGGAVADDGDNLPTSGVRGGTGLPRPNTLTD